jgi:diacylglycerol kinase family enzyme
MKVTLIHNPKAGADALSAEQITTLIRAQGHSVNYQSSKSEEMDDVLESRCDLVAVAGGDGTVAEVAKKLHGGRTPIAILPTGTANNIVKTLAPEEMPIEARIAGWNTGSLKKFDVGIATGPWGTRPFVECIGVGLFASTMSRLDARRNIELTHVDNPGDKLTSVVEILLQRLDERPVKRVTVLLDGEDLSGEYLLVEAMNTKYVGPGLNLAPDADVEDGLLDVVLIDEGEQRKLKRYLAGLLKGRSDPPDFRVIRAGQIQITWEGFDVHIDDEVWPETGSGFALESAEIEITVEPFALTFLVPPLECGDSSPL